MSKQIENLEVSASGEDNFSLSWNRDGKRYHIWTHASGVPQRSTLHPERLTLYCNPPRDVKRGEPGHFATKCLDGTNAVNSKIVAKALDQAHTSGEFEKARARWADEQAEEEAERQRRIRLKITDEDELALLRIASTLGLTLTSSQVAEQKNELKLIAEKLQNLRK